jgi:Tol biopolymer transport system component
MPITKLILAVCLTLFASICQSSPDKVGVISQHPSLSPTGKEIVFSADFDGLPRIWLWSTELRTLRKLSAVYGSSSSIADSEPTWSPDGRKIAYASTSGALSDIWVMDSTGAYPVKLTGNGANNSSPAWSPDGRKLAFISDRDGSDDLWLMNVDGSQPVKLVNSPSQESSPSFSPSGDAIVFAKTDLTVATLMVVNTNGTGLRSLTTGTSSDWEPHWGRGGIVFSTNRDARSDDWKLWTVQPDGSGLRKLGDVAGHDPRWTPEGTVVFTDTNTGGHALTSIAVLDPATGLKRVLIDVQGVLTPIDVRPGKAPNLINPNSAGRLQVAVLSTRTFDAPSSVDASTLTFGRTGAESSRAACSKTFRDVNGDGLPDLVCRFALRSAAFQMGDVTAVLRFADKKGVYYEGRDSIVTVPQDDPDDFKPD